MVSELPVHALHDDSFKRRITTRTGLQLSMLPPEVSLRRLPNPTSVTPFPNAASSTGYLRVDLGKSKLSPIGSLRR